MRLWLCLMCLMAFSVPASAENPNANINKGDVAAGGGFTLGYNTVAGTTFSLYPKVEYFIADNLSLGGSISFITGGGASVWAVGPSATYYFWTKEKMASYVGAGLFLNAASDTSTNNVSGEIDLGWDWFIVPTVALGPQLQVLHTFNDQDLGDNTYYNLLGMFSIFF